MAARARVVVAGVLALVAVTPFIGGHPSPFTEPAAPVSDARPVAASNPGAQPPSDALESVRVETDSVIAVAAPERDLNVDVEHLAQKPVPPPPPPVTGTGGGQQRRQWLADQGLSCPGNVGGSPGGAPGITSPAGVGGTTSADLASFAAAYNAIRVANCLHPVPASNFRYDACMEARLIWMAEDPSTDPASAWGHGSPVRSDGVPVVGCDGNLAGGSGNTGATVAQKWWNSAAHRNSLYRPSITGPVGGVCIYFAMSHGGVPNEPYSYTRAAARWGGC